MGRKISYKTLKIIFTIFLMHLCSLTYGQAKSKEVLQCTKVKKKIFERELTFSFFMHGSNQESKVYDHCDKFTPFIVGGKPANPKEFPHMARLGVNKDGRPTAWICGGTLISEKYVLTAAHCFFAREGSVNVVRLGELDFSTTNDDAQPEDFGVKRKIKFPNYDFDINENDIGLIELDRIVEFSEYIHPACLPVRNGDELNQFIAIGWGSKAFATSNSDLLQKVIIDRYSYENCRSKVDFDEERPPLNRTTQLCANSAVAKDTCNGDSGGPLLAYHNDYPCMYFAVGITSSGVACGTPNVPAVYTRVYAYLNWVKSIIYA